MRKKIRVAMIIQAYYPRIGGAEHQLAALAPLLRERGIEVVILTRRYAGLLPFEDIEGVPVYRLPIPGPKALAAVVFTLSALPLLRRLKPDVIHAHELLSPTTTAIAAKRLFGTPIVAKVLRGGSLGDLAKLHHNPLGRGRINQIRKWVDVLITISQEIDRELDENGISERRRVSIPNGVDVERFRLATDSEKQALRSELDLPAGPMVVFAGRLAPEKGVDLLISVWKEVRKTYPDATLLIVGTGEEMQRLMATAGEGVRFMGGVDDVAPYLRSADVFVLPSATEGLSNALLEALACGVPALATSVGGSPDVITHGESGWLIPPDDSAALRDGIETLLGDSSLRRRLRRSSLERIQREYLLSVAADRLRDLYDTLLEGSKS